MEVGGATEVGWLSVACPLSHSSSSTAETTIADAATAAAISAAIAPLVRYHGTGAGLKFQVVRSNASKRSGSASAPAAGSSHR